MDEQTTERRRRPRAARARAGAARLVLVRLGQLRVRDHIATVLFAPYLTSVAEQAACGFVGTTDRPVHARTSRARRLGLARLAGVLRRHASRRSSRRWSCRSSARPPTARRARSTLMAGFAWVGQRAAALMFFVTGSNWQLGALLLFVANICLGSSLVVYDAILCEIADPDERDRVSSRGWALGYLGGGLLLAREPRRGHRRTKPRARRPGWRCGSACSRRRVWWAGFTRDPLPRDPRPRRRSAVVPERGRPGAAELRAAVRDAARHAQLPGDADLPGRLPVLQRRHPDRDRVGLGVRRRSSSASGPPC